MNLKCKCVFITCGLLVACLMVACGGDAVEGDKKKGQDHLVEIVTTELGIHGVERVRTGSLRARKEVKIFNQEEGRITKLPYFEGDRVKGGDLVAKLDDQLLRAQLNRAKATYRQAKQDVDRLKNLFKKKLVSDEELNRGETALEVAKVDQEVLRTRIGYTSIAAPFDGVISARLSEPGNIADKYTHLLTIADPTSLITEVTLSELLITKLKLNDEVQVQIDALGNKVHTGSISRIHPNLNPVTRRGTVEVELSPVPEGARPGQLCRVQFNVQTSQKLTIPFKALRRDQQGEYVFVVGDEDKVERKAVKPGLRMGERVEVLSGLTVGERVISKGFLGLASGKKVKIVAPQVNSDKAENHSPVVNNESPG